MSTHSFPTFFQFSYHGPRVGAPNAVLGGDAADAAGREAARAHVVTFTPRHYKVMATIFHIDSAIPMRETVLSFFLLLSHGSLATFFFYSGTLRPCQGLFEEGHGCA